MIQEILAQIVVIAALAYAMFSIVKTVYPYTKKNTVSCKTGNCNCSVSDKKIKSTRLTSNLVNVNRLNNS